MPGASPETWTQIAEDWDRAVEFSRQAAESLKKIPGDPNTGGHRKLLVRNLLLTIADGYVRVGLNHEKGAAQADRNSLKAACNYVKADGLDCFRVGAIRAAFRKKTQTTFLSAFLARLGRNKVEANDGRPMTSATHRFSSLTLKRDGLHFEIEETIVELAPDGKMVGKPRYHRGVVPYREDFVPGSSIQFGCLQLESQANASWPKQLRRMWRTLGVLEEARQPQDELEWLKAGGEDKP